MKLSDAILLGSTLSPQAVAAFQKPDGSRCALGAALVACGVTLVDDVKLLPDVPNSINPHAFDWAKRLWPHIWRGEGSYDIGQFIACPDECCGGTVCCIADGIMHLNDVHAWTRERIAVWVKQFDSLDSNQEHSPCVGQVPIPSSLATETCCVESKRL